MELKNWRSKMNKLLLVFTLLFFPFTVFAQKAPSGETFTGIDGKFHPVKGRKFKKSQQELIEEQLLRIEKRLTNQTKTSQAELDRIVKEIEAAQQVKPASPVVLKSRRLWVEDVFTPGLWYYGYYASVDGVLEFRYSRKEYKAALSNFYSLYSLQHRQDVKNSSRPPVKVIYEYPY
jgi:hypothetical protein